MGGWRPPARIVRDADKIVAELIAVAPKGNRRNCPGCDNLTYAGYSSNINRPVCPTCWARLPLDMRTAWKSNRLNAEARRELRQAIEQWFADNPKEQE
jgi:hypothetical protein